MKSRKMEMGAENITDLKDALAAEAVEKLLHTYIPWLEKALEDLDREEIWERPKDTVNSIGNLLMHLEGNVRQWILHGLGGEEDTRQRDAEFTATDGASAGELLANLRDTVEKACRVINGYRNAGKLLSPLVIQDFRTTAFAAIVHVVEHFSYHTGQIVWIAKLKTGKNFKFYNL